MGFAIAPVCGESSRQSCSSAANSFQLLGRDQSWQSPVVPIFCKLLSNALPSNLILLWSLPAISASPSWVEELQGCQILQYSDYFLKSQLLK